MSLKSQAFTSSGTFNVPSGVTCVWASGIGGGGQGMYGLTSDGLASGQSAGGSAAYCYGVPIKVTSGGTLSIVIGAGGIAGLYPSSAATSREPMGSGCPEISPASAVIGAPGTFPTDTVIGSMVVGYGQPAYYGASAGGGSAGGGGAGGARFWPGGSCGTFASLGVAAAGRFFGGSSSGELGATTPGPSGGAAPGLTGGAGGTNTTGAGFGSAGGASSPWGVGGAGGNKAPGDPNVTAGGVGIGYGSGGGGGQASAVGANNKAGGSGASGYVLLMWTQGS